MSKSRSVELNINTATYRLDVPARTTLLSVLRDDLKLKGTRIGCSEERCGACTVLVDGAPTQSCRLDAEFVAGKNVTTIEGLHDQSQRGRDIIALFVDEQAAQCGYCINGIIVSLTGLFARVPQPTRAEILDFLDERHLCRCGAHPRILRVIDRLLGARS